jgi:hypothetical protein
MGLRQKARRRPSQRLWDRLTTSAAELEAVGFVSNAGKRFTRDAVNRLLGWKRLKNVTARCP